MSFQVERYRRTRCSSSTPRPPLRWHKSLCQRNTLRPALGNRGPT